LPRLDLRLVDSAWTLFSDSAFGSVSLTIAFTTSLATCGP